MTETKPPYLLWLADRLEPETLYSPASLADILRAIGRLEDATAAHRARLALSRHAARRGFPAEGDGTISSSAGVPVPAWSGKRWLAS